MSRHDDSVRLRHILDAARKAVSVTVGKTRAEIVADDVVQLALARLLEIFRTTGQKPRVPSRSFSTRCRLLLSPVVAKWNDRFRLAGRCLPDPLGNRQEYLRFAYSL